MQLFSEDVPVEYGLEVETGLAQIHSSITGFHPFSSTYQIQGRVWAET